MQQRDVVDVDRVRATEIAFPVADELTAHDGDLRPLGRAARMPSSLSMKRLFSIVRLPPSARMPAPFLSGTRARCRLRLRIWYRCRKGTGPPFRRPRQMPLLSPTRHDFRCASGTLDNLALRALNPAS
jgi:hypothetical protein